MRLQEEKIQDYCKLKGFDVIFLKEPDVSGKIRLYDRPEGSKIKQLLSNGYSHVVALKLDRLFRNAGDALVVSEEWLKLGASLHIIDMSGSAIDTGSPQGRMFFTMLAGFAEFERGMISERITAALQHKKKNNIVYSGKTAYGLTAVGDRLVPNIDEQAAISKMQSLRESGANLRKIASELNASDIKTKEGRFWHPYSIARILEAHV